MAACEAGKVSMYLRSILDDLGIEQSKATIVYEDNTGALMMGNARQPTRRTRHMDVKYFALQDWIDQDLVLLHDIESANNISDAFTKQLGRNLFYAHFDIIMGRKPPLYYKGTYASTKIDDQS